MATLVPSALTFDGVHFPLEASELGVGLASSVEELEALRYVLDEIVNGGSRNVPLETLAREGFGVQELSSRPISPAASPRSLWDGPINWRRLSGKWPDLADAHIVSAGFVRRALAIPRPVLISLATQLRTLRDEILSGKREGRVDDEKIPPPRALTPELEQHEALRKKSSDEAQAYREKLYARRR